MFPLIIPFFSFMLMEVGSNCKFSLKNRALAHRKPCKITYIIHYMKERIPNGNLDVYSNAPEF